MEAQVAVSIQKKVVEEKRKGETFPVLALSTTTAGLRSCFKGGLGSAKQGQKPRSVPVNSTRLLRGKGKLVPIWASPPSRVPDNRILSHT